MIIARIYSDNVVDIDGACFCVEILGSSANIRRRNHCVVVAVDSDVNYCVGQVSVEINHNAFILHECIMYYVCMCQSGTLCMLCLLW